MIQHEMYHAEASQTGMAISNDCESLSMLEQPYSKQVGKGGHHPSLTEAHRV
jgi:hypothetical protein